MAPIPLEENGTNMRSKGIRPRKAGLNSCLSDHCHDTRKPTRRDFGVIPNPIRRVEIEGVSCRRRSSRGSGASAENYLASETCKHI